MTLPDIDFHKIRAYDGSRQSGFEELCAQLASLETLPTGAVFHRKGRGGDAGVECFVRHSDGSECGWQAKWLFDWESVGLSAQLDDSIGTALEKHPTLTQYVVCLPFDLSDSRRKGKKSALQKWTDWKNKWLKHTTGKKRPLEIALWGKSELSLRLTADAPPYSGHLFYWFDETHFTPEWFLEQFARTKVALGSRYTPDTNVELPLRQSFLAFARDPDLQATLDSWHLQVVDKGRDAVDALSHAASKGAQDLVSRISGSIDALRLLLWKDPMVLGEQYPLNQWIDAAGNCRKAVNEALHLVWSLPETKKDTFSTSPQSWARIKLTQLSDLLTEIAEALSGKRWTCANATALLLEGEAGIGKSHLLADVVQYQLEAGRPALLLLGSWFKDEEPWRQVVLELGLSPTVQPKHFLGAMDAAAQAARVRALVCIDALNEKLGTDIWPNRLAAFLHEARTYRNIGIVLSCRSTYLEYVVPDSLPPSALERIHHTGFAANGGEAARAYLDARGIVRLGTPNMLPEFNNPLFLKTCCDLLEKEGKRELPRGLKGVTDIFEFYFGAIERSLTARLNLDPHLNIVRRALDAFTDALVKRSESYLSVSETTALFQSVLPTTQRQSSLLVQLESEGLLSIEPMPSSTGSTSQMVRFTFERISDHLIARRALTEHLNISDPAASFQSGTPLAAMIFGDRAYRFAGIVEAIAIQLPERTGKEILDVVGEKVPHMVKQAFWHSLLWRGQVHFTDRTLELAKSLRGPDDVTDLLLAISTEPANKFNAKYLHGKLSLLSVPERDERWSTFLANRYDDDDSSSIGLLITWTFKNGLEAIEDDRAELLAIVLSWFLTTSSRIVRDRATKALAVLFAGRLKLAASTLQTFSIANDLYVRERLYAAVYGAVLQGIALAVLAPIEY